MDWTALAATGPRAKKGPQLSLARGSQSKVRKFPPWNSPQPRRAPRSRPETIEEVQRILARKAPVKGRKKDWAPGSQSRAFVATVRSVMAPCRNPQARMVTLRRQVVARCRPAVALRRKVVALLRPVVACRRPVYWRRRYSRPVERFGRVLAQASLHMKLVSSEPCKARVRRHGAALRHH